MKTTRCNRNPCFLADFIYEGELSDGYSFSLRIPEQDVVEFSNTLLQAYKDEKEGKVKVTPPHVHVSKDGNVFHDGKVERIKD